MKQKAITLVEIIVAMTVLTALSLIALPAIKHNSEDAELMKFRHVYGTVSAVVSELIDNKALYPEGGFANTDSVTMRNTGRQFGGTTKFKNAFKEKFNVLEDDITINESNMPIYDMVNNSTNITTTTKTSSLECFTNNTGTFFCPPNTPNPTGTSTLKNIYLRVHVTEKHTAKDAIYFAIATDGKIEFPYKIEGKFDCTKQEYNKHSQCKVISMLDEL